MLVELLCLLVFTLRLVHYAKVIPQDKFWKDPKNICIIAIVMVGRIIFTYRASLPLVLFIFSPGTSAHMLDDILRSVSVDKVGTVGVTLWCGSHLCLGHSSKLPAMSRFWWFLVSKCVAERMCWAGPINACEITFNQRFDLVSTSCSC